MEEEETKLQTIEKTLKTLYEPLRFLDQGYLT